LMLKISSSRILATGADQRPIVVHGGGGAAMITRTSALAFSDVQTGVSLVGTTTTVLAVVVGGLWAYFKFLRGRTYRPRLSVGMEATWHIVNDRHVVHARITVKNIGASVVTPRPHDMGLRVSVPAQEQPNPPAEVRWEVIRVFEVLGEHEWIEASETVSDDVLLDIDSDAPEVILLEARLPWSWAGHKKEIVVVARQIFLPDPAASVAGTTAQNEHRTKEEAHV
jgi:hypothetical protein